MASHPDAALSKARFCRFPSETMPIVARMAFRKSASARRFEDPPTNNAEQPYTRPEVHVSWKGWAPTVQVLENACVGKVRLLDVNDRRPEFLMQYPSADGGLEELAEERKVESASMNDALHPLTVQHIFSWLYIQSPH
jgi:hypothetical protein